MLLLENLFYWTITKWIEWILSNLRSPFHLYGVILLFIFFLLYRFTSELVAAVEMCNIYYIWLSFEYQWNEHNNKKTVWGRQQHKEKKLNKQTVCGRLFICVYRQPIYKAFDSLFNFYFFFSKKKKNESENILQWIESIIQWTLMTRIIEEEKKNLNKTKRKMNKWYIKKKKKLYDVFIDVDENGVTCLFFVIYLPFFRVLLIRGRRKRERHYYSYLNNKQKKTSQNLFF